MTILHDMLVFALWLLAVGLVSILATGVLMLAWTCILDAVDVVKEWIDDGKKY